MKKYKHKQSMNEKNGLQPNEREPTFFERKNCETFPSGLIFLSPIYMSL